MGFFTSSALAGATGATAGLSTLTALSSLAGSADFFASSGLAGVTGGAVGFPSLAALSSLAGSAGFFTSPGLTAAGDRMGGLVSLAGIGGAEVGGAPATGVRNAPISGFFFSLDIDLPPNSSFMSKNVSHFESHFQPKIKGRSHVGLRPDNGYSS